MQLIRNCSTDRRLGGELAKDWTTVLSLVDSSNGQGTSEKELSPLVIRKGAGYVLHSAHRGVNLSLTALEKICIF